MHIMPVEDHVRVGDVQYPEGEGAVRSSGPDGGDEGFYRILFESCPDALLLLEPLSGEVLLANRAADDLYGFSRDTWKWVSWSSLAGGGDANALSHILQAAEAKAGGVLLWQRGRAGVLFPTTTRVRVVRMGTSERLLLSVRGMGKQRLEALETRRILELSQELICIAATNGYFQYVNPAWERILGYSGQELLARPFLDFIHPDDHPKNDQEVARLLAGQPSLDFENRYLHRDGSVVHVSWVATPLPDEGLLFCMGRDITGLKRAEEALRQSEERFRISFDSASIARVMTRPDGSFLRVNERFCQMLGYTRDEFTRLDFRALTHPEDLEASRVCIQRLLSGQVETYRFEKRYLHRDGHVVWVDLSTTLIRDDEGGPLFFLTDIQDVSRRKAVEEELRLAAVQWQTTFDAVKGAIFLLDAEQHIVRVNRAAEELFQMNRKEMLGRYCWEVVHPDGCPHPLCPARRAFASHGRESMDLPIGGRWFEEVVDPLTDSSQKGVGAVHVLNDISDRKAAEKELRRSRDRLERLNALLQLEAGSIQDFMDQALAGSIRITESRIGYIYLYSEEKREFTLNSWSREVMEQCRVMNPQTIYQLEKTGLWGEAVRQRRPILVNDFEAPDPLKKGYPPGHVGLKRFLTVPVVQEGSIVAVVGVGNREDPYDASDVLQLTLLMDGVWKSVERRRAEEEKRLLEEQFRQAQKMESIGKLAGGVAHDFNNLLTVIISYAETLLHETPPSSEQHRDLQEILDAGKRSADLTRQLLTFSRLQTIQPVFLNISRIVRNLEKMLRRLLGEDITFDLLLEEGIDPVLADPGQLEQVVMNLVVNARDALPGGGRIGIETRTVELDAAYCALHREMSPGTYVMLSVSDNGCGMDDHVREHLFEPFFTTKATGKGTGLGLATVYGIVKQAGGHIWVYSEKGKGSTFRIYLPTTLGNDSPVTGSASSCQDRFLDCRLLVVEDEEVLRNLVARLLSDLVLELRLVPHGADALDLIRSGAFVPDLVLTDLVMPGVNGLDLATQIREMLPDIRVVFMSGYSEHTLLEQDDLASSALFVQKPFSRQVLCEVLARSLEGKGERPSPGG